MKLLDIVKKDNLSKQDVELTLEEYLNLAKKDATVYDSPAQRMLRAIGGPEVILTEKDPKLSRIFLNKPIKNYHPFVEFFGLEEVFEKIVDYLKHAAQGLEESKQILYLLGPVGGAKSSIAHILRVVFESVPFYEIKGSPVHDHPLSLFDKNLHGAMLEKEFKIPKSKLGSIKSKWLVKRIEELGGDISQLKIVKRYPSMQNIVASARTEPGDETNQDISTLVGKMNVRLLNKLSQDDPDAYLYSGALNVSNQGILEFVEMFKAPIKLLHPLLCATQDKMYSPTEGIGSLPYDGIILAHSNESEWSQFKSDPKNEAFIDRVYIVKVPYVLRFDEEIKVYQKLIKNSELRDAPIAPKTLEFLAKFFVLSRLKRPENSKVMSKLLTYNGESLKGVDKNAKSLLEYKDDAGVDEGMSGLSTRFAYKVLSKTFNFDPEEIGANPIHLMYVLQAHLKQEHLNEDQELILNDYLDALEQEYIADLAEDIQKAFTNSSGFCQNIFDNYLALADAWLEERSYLDPDTGATLDLDEINDELEHLEGAAELTSSKQFRQDVVTYAYKHKSKHGENPAWDAYAKIKDVIKSKVLVNLDEMLPVLVSGKHKNDDDYKKHTEFVNRMQDLGYTARQTKVVVEYYRRVRKS